MSKRPPPIKVTPRVAPGRTKSETPEPTRAVRKAISSLKMHCRGLPHVTEDVKWGDHTVFMIGSKMFSIFNVDDGPAFSFKCDDDDFDRLCDEPGIIPAPYAARFGWVQVTHPRVIPAAEARRLLTKARDLVLAKLPRRVARSLHREG